MSAPTWRGAATSARSSSTPRTLNSARPRASWRRTRGDNAFLAGIYGIEASAELEPARKLRLYLQQAELYSGSLADLDGAIQALARGAQQRAGRRGGDVINWRALCRGARPSRVGEDATRDLRKAAELHYQIAEAVVPEDALDYLEAALAAAPDHDGALHLMEQLAARLGRSELLPKYWLGYLASASEGPELDQRRMSMAAVYAEAGQLDDAIMCLEQVRTEGMAVQALSELKALRGPRLLVSSARCAAAGRSRRPARRFCAPRSSHRQTPESSAHP